MFFFCLSWWAYLDYLSNFTFCIVGLVRHGGLYKISD